jgi:tetratricopeptide (TPR) repeat protein
MPNFIKSMSVVIKLSFVLICIIFLTNCKKNVSNEESAVLKTDAELKIIEQRQDSIIDKYLRNGAWKYNYYTPEWQTEIDKGLAEDSTIAYLWQQKAMPLFKQGKYEVGMEYIDKAVKYNRQRWQDYRAFIKCIFAKTYREAIIDFEECKVRFGNQYVMDHTYDFHIALSYLQLNEFKKAEEIFKRDYEKVLAERGKDWTHPVDLFYYGISKYELGKYEEAIGLFDLALEIHTQFSDVQYYKARSLEKIGKIEAAKEMMAVAKNNAEQGYSFNEDNAVYERYPYQVRW